MTVQPWPRRVEDRADDTVPPIGEELADEEMTPELLADLAASERDFAQGRSHGHDEAMAIIDGVVARIKAGTFDPDDFPELERLLARRGG